MALDKSELLALVEQTCNEQGAVAVPGSVLFELVDNYIETVADEKAGAVLEVAEGAQSAAEAAQSTADGAQSAAEAAQSTADGAQSAAEAAQSTADGAQSALDNLYPYYVDIDFPIVVRTTGAGIPTLATLKGNITAPQWAVNDVNMCEGQELIHAWEEGSEMYWHLHLTTNGVDVADRYVNFEVEHCHVIPNGVVSDAVTDSVEFKIPANTPDRTSFIVPISSLTIAGGKIGSHVFPRLKRVASVGTAPTANPFCNMLQLHVKCDTNGSKNIGTK